MVRVDLIEKETFEQQLKFQRELTILLSKEEAPGQEHVQCVSGLASGHKTSRKQTSRRTLFFNLGCGNFGGF